MKLGLFWLLALGSLPIIFAHWVLVPGFFIAGPWIGGAMGCLQTFAMLGWFGRRLLAMGRGVTVGVLIVVTGLSSAAGGLMLQMQNPDITPTMGVLMLALMGVASIVIQLWLFLKTRSAVIPALAYATFSSGLAGMTWLWLQWPTTAHR